MKLALNADSRVSKEKYVDTDAEEEEVVIGGRPIRKATFSVSFAENEIQEETKVPLLRSEEETMDPNLMLTTIQADIGGSKQGSDDDSSQSSSSGPDTSSEEEQNHYQSINEESSELEFEGKKVK